MDFIAVATDYDGTLAQDGVVDAATLAALERLKASGRFLILVTGRELGDLKRVLPDLNRFDIIVAENGALLYLPETAEERPIGPEPPEGFVTALRHRGVSPLSIGRGIVATWEPNETAVLETIREQGLEWQIIFNKGAVMVLPPGVNKSSGLAAALDVLQLSPINVVGIGDAENDHAFLTFCGCSVAVANALEAVKETADVVTAGERGAGVVELIDRLLGNGEPIPHPARHSIAVGTSSSGEDAALRPDVGGVLIAGSSGIGKSTLATAILERIGELSFQFIVADPEGDYVELEDAIVFGDAKRVPSVTEALELLASPTNDLVLNMLGLEIEDRPALFAELLPQISRMRAKTGRPHWLLIDEAHHLLPATSVPAAMSLPKSAPATIYVTVHPTSMSAEALAGVDVVIAVGEGAGETVSAFCNAAGIATPVLPDQPPGREEILWWDRKEGHPRIVKASRSRQQLRRHTRKYAEGTLGKDKSFYFRGPNNALNLRAQNLMMFLQIAEGVDDATWLHHLKCRDYSQWFRDAIKDLDLADEVERVERGHDPDPTVSRAIIRDAVTSRYTAPR
jgi:hydroxymethylpyrimidine pyrophosphatase-like HAD family hydrolase